MPGDDDGLGWRTRVQYAVDDDGTAGLRRHRSHEVVPVDDCLIAHPLVESAGVTRRSWPAVASVEVAASPGTGQVLVLPDGRGDGVLTEVVGDREYQVRAGGFWQVHPGAAATLLGAVLDALEPRPGDAVLDLYAGVGLFAAGLADRVSPGGRVTAVEAGQRAVQDARANLDGRPGVRVERGRVDHVLRRQHLRRGGPRGAGPAAVGCRPVGRGPAVPRRRPGGSPTWPAIPPRWPATSGGSPSAATCWRVCGPSTCSR